MSTEDGRDVSQADQLLLDEVAELCRPCMIALEGLAPECKGEAVRSIAGKLCSVCPEHQGLLRNGWGVMPVPVNLEMTAKETLKLAKRYKKELIAELQSQARHRQAAMENAQHLQNECDKVLRYPCKFFLRYEVGSIHQVSTLKIICPHALIAMDQAVSSFLARNPQREYMTQKEVFDCLTSHCEATCESPAYLASYKEVFRLCFAWDAIKSCGFYGSPPATGVGARPGGSGVCATVQGTRVEAGAAGGVRVTVQGTAEPRSRSGLCTAAVRGHEGLGTTPQDGDQLASDMDEDEKSDSDRDEDDIESAQHGHPADPTEGSGSGEAVQDGDHSVQGGGADQQEGVDLEQAAPMDTDPSVYTVGDGESLRAACDANKADANATLDAIEALGDWVREALASSPGAELKARLLEWKAWSDKVLDF